MNLPTSSLSNLPLDDNSFKVDFELTDKYQAFSSELLRVSLLGIAGYGFLISEVVLKESNSSNFFNALAQNKYLLGIGVFFLGIAAALALAHRYFSTDSLAHFVTILRLYKRNESLPRLADASERLKNERSAFREDLIVCKWLLVGSVVFLLLGIISVAITFSYILFSQETLVNNTN